MINVKYDVDSGPARSWTPDNSVDSDSDMESQNLDICSIEPQISEDAWACSLTPLSYPQTRESTLNPTCVPILLSVNGKDDVIMDATAVDASVCEEINEAVSDAMNNIIVPLYHMQCHLAEVRIVHEGQFVSRIF